MKLQNETHKIVREISSLEFSNICFSYDSEEKLFDGLSFKVTENSCIYLCADDFRGISTFTKILCGLVSPQSGGYFINSHDVCEMTFEEFLPWRLEIGYAFETGGLLSNLTLLENLTLPLKYHSTLSHQEINERVGFYINYFDLETVKNKRPAMVNSSSKKLTILARSMIHQPQCLILDDPDNGLNKAQVLKVIALVKKKIEHENLRLVFVASRLTKLWDEVFTHQLVIGSKLAHLQKWSSISEESA